MTVPANMPRFVALWRKKSIASAFLLLLLAPAGGMAAERVTGPTMLDRLSGTTLIGEYASGRQFSERFEGRTRSLYAEGAVRAVGAVSIQAGNLCFTYDRSDFSGGCFEIRKQGTNCYLFYPLDAGTGEPLEVLRNRQLGLGWTARGWLMGTEPDCVSELMS